MRYKKIIRAVSYTILVLLFVTVTIDFMRISSYNVYVRNPIEPIVTYEEMIYRDLQLGKTPDWQSLQSALDFISKEYDVSDFKLVNIIRILYEHPDKIPAETRRAIDKTLLGFRYWMDEPGENSMCYWSENHQILFASAEYLIGNLYTDKTFTNSNLTGEQHKNKARQRIFDWLEMRWLHGFTEFYSGTYYIEDIAALINLIDYTDDEEIKIKSQIVLDLLFYDISTQSNNYFFTTVSGRAYKDNRTGKHNNLGGAVNLLKEDSLKIHHGLLNGLYNTEYKLPQVFKEIVRDTGNIIIQQKNGMNLDQFKESEYNKTDEKGMMMQWGMEAFVNPQVIRNTMQTVRKNNMFSNDFLKDLKMLNFTIIRWLHLEPLIVRLLNIPQQGKAIQQSNTYTYKSKDYSLYSVQDYHPGTYADQHHVAGMNVGNHFSVFHTHPAREKNVDIHSPNYWVGYGRLPHVVQNENISMAIYAIDKYKNMMEKELPDYTYAYFPRRNFDSVYIENNYAFGRKENTYVALIAYNKLSYRDEKNEELIQPGKNTFWIMQAGSSETDSSFNEFKKRILKNKVSYNAKQKQLIYHSENKKLELNYQKDFAVNNIIVNNNYPRFSTAYAKVNNNELFIQYNNKALHLDFFGLKREEK